MTTARSLNQVVAESNLPWLKTPDQAMVWATAVGLQPQLDLVLQRSLEDVNANPSVGSRTYFPAWFVANAALAGAGGAGGGGRGGSAGSVFSASAIPNFGGMLAALGTIGAGTISTSSGSSGGGSFSSGSFGGGSSGGGGGGAGGGF